MFFSTFCAFTNSLICKELIQIYSDLFVYYKEFEFNTCFASDCAKANVLSSILSTVSESLHSNMAAWMVAQRSGKGHSSEKCKARLTYLLPSATQGNILLPITRLLPDTHLVSLVQLPNEKPLPIRNDQYVGESV